VLVVLYETDSMRSLTPRMGGLEAWGRMGKTIQSVYFNVARTRIL